MQEIDKPSIKFHLQKIKSMLRWMEVVTQTNCGPID